YERFFDAFGIQLKYGLYSDFGAHKDVLKDLILFHSSNEQKYVSLKEYVAGMKEEQKAIYYASGESIDKIEILPQVATVKAKGYEVLYLTDDVDEFALRVLGTYEEKEFKNVTAEALDLATEEEKAAEKTANEAQEEMLGRMKEAIGKVSQVRFNSSLVDYAVCLSSEGDLSVEMAKILRKMPGSEDMGVPDASVILEINMNHPIADKLKALAEAGDNEKLEKYARLLYAQACLIGGIAIDEPQELTKLICELMV
ncbi:MAG: molecular chaperone HtpG, partial [Clostridia bacterium]|nr:molecular chaperone HtpG [Clostridia bacterium]